MESADPWTVLNVVPGDKTGEDATSTEFGYTVDGPSAGKDGCFRLTHVPSSTGTWSNTAIFQAVKIKANTNYIFSAAFKNIDNLTGGWAEFQYTTTMPAGGGADWIGDVTLANFMDPTWGSLCTEGTYDVLAKDACETATGEEIIIMEAGTDGEEITIYIGVKIGDDGNSAALEFLIDEFSLIESQIPVSIREFGFKKSLKIYPNPASNKINIENVDSEEIHIYNLLGKRIYSTIATSDLVTIDISSFKTGIYILQAGATTSKFIKK